MPLGTITQFRNKQYAAWFFGAQSPMQYMYAIPRYKYMFYANFIVNSQATVLYPWLRELGGLDGISFKIRTIDKPNIELQQRELNQYNRKRYAYVKTDYRPVNVTIYDTVDNKPLDMWRQYFTYYFGDARQKSQTVMDESVVNPTFTDGTGWGLRPLGEQVNFFSQLDLYAIFGLRYTRVSYLNPKIQSVNWSNYDTSSSDLADMQMSISYETVRYDPSAPITPGIAALFGFDVGPPAVEPDVSLSGTILRSAVGIADSLLAQRNLENNSVAGIVSVAASAVANFGLAMTSYNAFTRTGYGPWNGQPYGTAIPQSITYTSALGAFDNVNGETSISGDYADVTGGGEPILVGLPDGQLPDNTGQINSASQSFTTTENQSTSTIANYGAHNFGSGGFDPGVPNGYTFGAGAGNGSPRSYAYQGRTGDNQWQRMGQPDYRFGGFAENEVGSADTYQTNQTALPGLEPLQSTQTWPGAFGDKPIGDPRVPGYDDPTLSGANPTVGQFSVTDGNPSNSGFTRVSGKPSVRGYATTRGGSSQIPQNAPKPDSVNNRQGIPYVPPAK